MAQTLRAQIEASKPTKKQLWRAIVQEKIRSQARLLVEKRGMDRGLAAMAKDVRSGDTSNREGAAATLYFAELFGPGFARVRRDRARIAAILGEPVDADASTTFRIANALLNYGYAVLRAAVARAVVLAGLHPALGIFHRHRENTFSLADDLMEPLRVLVDRIAFDIVEEMPQLPNDLTPELKRRVLALLTAEVRWGGAMWPLDAALEAYAAGVRACLIGETKELAIPAA